MLRGAFEHRGVRDRGGPRPRPGAARYLGVAIEEVLFPGSLARANGLTALRGLALESLTEGGPAARAGLQRGDIIVGFAGRPVESAADLHRLLNRDAIEVAIEVEVLRGGRKMSLPIRPAEVPFAPE